MSFQESFNKLIGYEGIYSNDPDDKGGETFYGISRNANPSWVGWIIIDAMKSASSFPKNLDGNALLMSHVHALYKANYWDKVKGDELHEMIAEELFEQCVNLGVNTAIHHFIRALNILNDRARLYPDRDVKVMDETILLHYRMFIKKRNVKLLFNVLNGFQVKKYIELMEAYPQNEKWIGWFNRIEVLK